MKHLKRVLALVVAMVMALGMMSVTAFAAGTNRTISVAGLDDGDTVNFYKVLEWADDSAEATANKAVNGWYWAEPFKTKFAESGDMGQKKLKTAVNDKNVLVMTDALAGDIARALNGTVIKPVNVDADKNVTPVPAVNGTATWTFSNSEGTAADGLYVAIVTPADQDTVYSPIFVHLDPSTNADDYTVIISSSSYMNPGNNGAAKKSKVTLEKDATSAQDYNGDDGDTTAPGDVLDFTVKTTIPGYGKTFKAPFFTITDTMNGLELNPNSVEIKDETGAALPTTVTYIDDDGTEKTSPTYERTANATGYTYKLTAPYLRSLNTPLKIVITYKATVKEGANTNVVKEKNTVTLEFSHDATTETDGKPGGDKQYKKDVTNHYTFSIDANNLIHPDGDRIGTSGSEIIKIGVDADGNPIESTIWTSSNVTITNNQKSPLEGAKFKLYKAKIDPNDATKWVIDETKQVGDEVASDASGRINFTGLDEGVYFLQETEAPAGYVKNSDPVQITIDATLAPKTVTEYYDQQGNWYDTAAAGRTAFKYTTDELVSYSVTYGKTASSYTFDHVFESNNDVINWSIKTSAEAPQSIKNQKGVELPSTGGVGTTLFYVVGAILVLGAGVVLVTRRRMSAN